MSTLNEVIATQLEKVAQTYGINPLFAGLFGSEAKGYSGPDSDVDLYVPYVGAVSQYVKAITIDTAQIDNEPRVPAQETIMFQDSLGKEHIVQFNYESFDHFVQELTRSNLDFRLALDNILWKKPESEQVIALLDEVAAAYFDPVRVKHACLSRASKTLHQLVKKQVVNTSEVTDGLYRLLYALNLVDGDVMCIADNNQTHTYQRLLSAYMTQHPDDLEVKALGDGIKKAITDGRWRETYLEYTPALISVIERLVPEYQPRAAKLAGSASIVFPIDRTITGRFILASEVNKAFVQLLLKGAYYQ